MPSDSLRPGQSLPIREIARRTGINPVTLRAWERRYGLLCPERTGKGHRLYQDSDLARVRSILAWLNRGVPISQIRPLLDNPPTDLPPAPEGEWPEQLHEALLALSLLSLRRLDEQFNRLNALYPAVALCRYFLQPLLEQLGQRWHNQPGARLERAFLFGWLRTKLDARVQQSNRLTHGRPLLVANLHDSPGVDAHLSAWLLCNSDYPVLLLDDPLPLTEVLLAVDRLQPLALVLHGNGPSELPATPGVPIVLCNPLALQSAIRTPLQAHERVVALCSEFDSIHQEPPCT